MTISAVYETPAPVEDRQLQVKLSSEAGEANLWLNDDGYGYKLHTKVDGLGVADVENTMTALSSGGAVLRHQRLKEGDMQLPIQIKGNSKASRNELKTRLEAIVRPAAGPVRIHVYDPYSEDSRSRTVYYRAGLATPDWSSPTSALYGVVFDYAEAWWRGAERGRQVKVAERKKPFITARRGGPSPNPAFPFFPAFVYSSVVQGTYTLTIQGDENAWPTWRIVGPGKDLLIENMTTGEQLFVAGDIFEPLTIVTDPQRQDIYSASRTRGEWWGQVDKKASLFPLAAGTNKMRITMVGATQGSYVEYLYEEIWRAPY